MAHERTRLFGALAIAIALHLCVAFVSRELPFSTMPHTPLPEPIPLRLLESPRLPRPVTPDELVPNAFVTPSPPAKPHPPPPFPANRVAERPASPTSPPAVPLLPSATELPEPLGLPPPRVSQDPPQDDSLRLLPSKRSRLDRHFGTGSEMFSPRLSDLEQGLAYRAEGPLSDKTRTEQNARRLLEDALAEDAVDAGLVDDYFRELARHIEAAWRPARRELNDQGERTTQVGFLRDFGQNPQAMGEMWELYLDLARQYAQGEKPHIEQRRLERLREVMRSRKGNFRFHAITEAEVTHAADGQILTIELPLSSGHPSFDEGVRDALVFGVRAMTAPPPAALSRGRPFRSRWRLRATWKMIPPTALLSGNSFDITKNGI
ncbi:MAG: TonB C-terminal domain-containing protein, partial [Myxococcota bacterium]